MAFVEVPFVGKSFVSSMISSYVTTELPVILLHIYHFCNYILHDSKHNRFLTFNFFFLFLHLQRRLLLFPLLIRFTFFTIKLAYTFA